MGDNTYLGVSQKVILRKENFGGLLYIREKDTFLKLNQKGFVILKKLFSGKSLESLGEETEINQVKKKLKNLVGK
jgi:hypothetical protein